MRRILLRLGLAAILSLACFYATTWWYEKTGSHAAHNSNQPPVAFVAHTKDETLRRPVTRVIWQLINDGEPVYPGEAIRTSSEGEARIQFADSKRFIDLEPDSLIVISKSSDNEISLDLMDGGLQVNQGGAQAEGGPALTLKSGNSKVDLSKATASLSKASNGRIDLQVLNGKADIKGDGNLKQIDKDAIKILSPPPGQAYYMNPREPLPASFAWTGFPAGSLVKIEVGSTRKNLKVEGETLEKQIQLKLPPGKHFWKLTAFDPKTQSVLGESAVFRLEVAARTPPELTSPAADEKISPVKGQSLDLHWNRPASVKTVHLEISTTDTFENKILTKDFTNEEGFRHSFPEGDYYARLSAKFENSEQTLAGPIRRFHITSSGLPKVAINWTQSPADDKAYFVGTPAVALGWDSDQKDQVKSWRMKFADSEANLGDKKAISFETSNLADKFTLPRAGRYIASVEALNEKHQVIASSKPKLLNLQVQPLLPAPQFEGAKELDADQTGRLDLRWNQVDGAREYRVTLYDKDGKELHTAKFNKNTTALQNLLPGEFKVGVVAVDEHGRPGEKTVPKVVRVPATSGLAAPKIKRVKVN